jgi:hypothetical protein
MGPVGRLRRLPRGQRLLVLKAALLLAVLRLGLAVLPFAKVLDFVERVGAGRRGRRRGRRRGSDLDGWITAVAVAGPHVAPARPCLPQALLVLGLLRKAGRPAELRIGVKRKEDDGGETNGREGPFAHAWVESEGRVVIGGEDAPERYVALPPVRPPVRRTGRSRRPGRPRSRAPG